MAKKVLTKDLINDLSYYRQRAGLQDQGLFFVDIETAYNAASTKYFYLKSSGIYDISGIYLDPKTNTFHEIKFFIELNTMELDALPQTDGELTSNVYLSKDRYFTEMTNARSAGYTFVKNGIEVINALTKLPGFNRSIIVGQNISNFDMKQLDMFFALNGKPHKISNHQFYDIGYLMQNMIGQRINLKNGSIDATHMNQKQVYAVIRKEYGANASKYNNLRTTTDIERFLKDNPFVMGKNAIGAVKIVVLPNGDIQDVSTMTDQQVYGLVKKELNKLEPKMGWNSKTDLEIAAFLTRDSRGKKMFFGEGSWSLEKAIQWMHTWKNPSHPLHSYYTNYVADQTKHRKTEAHEGFNDVIDTASMMNALFHFLEDQKEEGFAFLNQKPSIKALLWAIAPSELQRLQREAKQAHDEQKKEEKLRQKEIQEIRKQEAARLRKASGAISARSKAEQESNKEQNKDRARKLVHDFTSASGLQDYVGYDEKDILFIEGIHAYYIIKNIGLPANKSKAEHISLLITQLSHKRELTVKDAEELNKYLKTMHFIGKRNQRQQPLTTVDMIQKFLDLGVNNSVTHEIQEQLTGYDAFNSKAKPGQYSELQKNALSNLISKYNGAKGKQNWYSLSKQQRDKLLAEETARLENSSKHAGDVGTWGHLIFEKANEAVKLGAATWGDTKALYSYLMNKYPRLMTSAERPDNGEQILAAAHFIHSHQPIGKVLMDYLARMSSGVEDFFYQKVLKSSGYKSKDEVGKNVISSMEYPFLFNFTKDIAKTPAEVKELALDARAFADNLGSIFSDDPEVVKRFPEIKGDKSLTSIIHKIERHEEQVIEKARARGIFKGNINIKDIVNRAVGNGINEYFFNLFPFLKGESIGSLSPNLRATAVKKIMQTLNTREAGAVIFYLSRGAAIDSRDFLRKSADIKRMSFTQTEKRIGIANTKNKEMYFGSIDALYHDANRWFTKNGDYTLADFKTTRAFHVGHVFQVGIMYPGMLGTVLKKNGKKLQIEPGVDIRVGLLGGQENLDTALSAGENQLTNVPTATDMKIAQERKRFLKTVGGNFEHLVQTIISGGARVIADFKYVFESGQSITVNTGESTSSFTEANAIKWVQTIERGGFQIGSYNLSLEDMMKIYQFSTPDQRKRLYWLLKNTLTQTYKELYGLYLSPNGSAKIKRIPESKTADQWTITENDIIYSLEKTFHMTGADILHTAWDSLLRKGDSGRSQIFGKNGTVIKFRSSALYKDFLSTMEGSSTLKDIYSTYEKNFRLGEMSRRMSSNPNEPSRGGSHFTNNARNEYDRISDELKDSKALQEAWDGYYKIMREFGLFSGTKAIQPFTQHLDFGKLMINDSVYHVIAMVKMALGDKKSGNGVIGDLLGERNGKFKNNKGEQGAINYLLEKYFEDEIKNINSYLIGNNKKISTQNKLFLSELVDALGRGMDLQQHFSDSNAATAHKIAHLLSVTGVNKYYVLRWKQAIGAVDNNGLQYKHLSQVTDDDVLEYLDMRGPETSGGKEEKKEDYRILAQLKSLSSKLYKEYQAIANETFMIPFKILQGWATSKSEGEREKIEKEYADSKYNFNSLKELYKLAKTYGMDAGNNLFYTKIIQGDRHQLDSFLYYTALRAAAQESLRGYSGANYRLSSADKEQIRQATKITSSDDEEEGFLGISIEKPHMSRVAKEIYSLFHLGKFSENVLELDQNFINTVDKIKVLLHVNSGDASRYMGVSGLSVKEKAMLSVLSPMGENLNPYLFVGFSTKPSNIISGRFFKKGIGGADSFVSIVKVYVKGAQVSLKKLGFLGRQSFRDKDESEKYARYLYSFVSDLHRIYYFLKSAASQNDYFAEQLRQVEEDIKKQSGLPQRYWENILSPKELFNLAEGNKFFKEGLNENTRVHGIDEDLGTAVDPLDVGAPSGVNYFPYMPGNNKKLGAKTLPEAKNALEEWKQRAKGIISKYKAEKILSYAYELHYILSRLKVGAFNSYLHRGTRALAFLMYHGKSVNFQVEQKFGAGALNKEYTIFTTSSSGRSLESRKKTLQELLSGFLDSFQFLKEMYSLLSEDWRQLITDGKIQGSSFEEIEELWKQVQNILPEEFGDMTENKINKIKLGGISMAGNPIYDSYLISYKERGFGIDEILAEIKDANEKKNADPKDPEINARLRAAGDFLNQLTTESTNTDAPREGSRGMSKLKRATQTYSGSYRGMMSTFKDSNNKAIYGSVPEMLNSVFGTMFYKKKNGEGAARASNIQAFANIFGHFDPTLGLMDDKGNKISQDEYINRFVRMGLDANISKEGLTAFVSKAINKSGLEDDQKAEVKLKVGKAIEEATESQESLQEKVTKELEKQVDLQKELLDLTTKINTAQRKKQVDTAASLGKDRKRLAKEQGKSYAKALKDITKIYRDMGYNEDDARTLALYGDHGKGINGLRDAYGQAVAENSTKAALERDQTREGDLRRREGLLRQRNSLKKSAYDNELTYRTTYDRQYRIALTEQQNDIARQLEDIERDLEELGERYKDDKAFNARAGEQDLTAKDLLSRGKKDIDVKHKGKDTLFGQLASQMSGIMTRFTQFGAAYKILGSLRQGFNNVVTSAKNLDKALTDLRIVTGQTGKEAKNTMQSFANLAAQLGVTTNEVAQSATAWLRQGYDMAQVTDLVTSSMYLSKLGMISVDEATQGLTSTLKGFKIEAREAMDIVDRFTALDVKAATTAGEIATGLAQFANLANMSGVSIDQASAMVATIADVSQVSGAQAGNSLKMMLSRYGTVKSGKFSSMEGEGDTEALNDVEKVLNKIGITMRDTSGQFKEFDQVLDEIAGKWDNLDNISQAAIATAVAGTRQREAFLVLMENMDKYRNFTEISENSEGTAEKKYQSYQEQLQAAQNRLAAAWEKMSQDADIASYITTFTNFATFMVKNLPTLLKVATRLISIWQGYKIPSALSSMGNFLALPGSDNFKIDWENAKLGAANAKANGKNRFKGWVQGFTQRKDEEVLSYDGGMSNLVRGILEEVTEINAARKGKGAAGAQEAKRAREVAQASQQQVENEKLKVVYSEESLQNEKGETYENATQYALEKQSTQAKAYNTNYTTSYVPSKGGKGGKGGKGTAAVAIASGAAGIISGLMTTGSTHFNSATGQTAESSGEASGAMKGASAAINTVGMVGYAWGPVVGMITQTVASMLDQFLTPFIGTWIDADRDARNARVEEAQKQLSSLEAIQSAVSNIESTVSSKAMTYEENQQLIGQMKELRNTLLENIDTLKQVADTMKTTSQEVFDTLGNWTDLSAEERQTFVIGVQAAINSLKANKTINAAENELYTAYQDAQKYQHVYSYEAPSGDFLGSDVPTERGHKELLEPFAQWMRATGEKATYTYTTFRNIAGEELPDKIETAFNTEGKELVRQYKSFIEYLAKEDAVKYATIIEEYQKVVRDYEAQLAKINEIYKEANEYLAAAALLTAKISIPTGGSVNLLTATSAQLKQAGKDKIREAVVQELLANGGFRGYAVDSKEGQAIIEQAIKSNEKLYAVWTGQIYTLNEALSTQNTEVLKSFATALGVSVDKLGDLKNELGDLRLSDILGSPADTRSKISELTSLFTSMASSSGLTAENLESIINKFPELIVNLKDSVSLGGSMLNMLDQYNALYSRQVLSDLLNNEDYFEQMMKELEKRSPNAYNDFIHNSKYKSATNVQGILGLLTEEYKEGSGISKETYDMLKSIYGEYFDFTIQSSLGTEAFEAYVSYWNKIWDKQISNLEEQKSAIQEITKQREYENKLIEARLRLENASKEKKRVYREGVGWVYEADQNAVKEAQENLEQVQREQTISELEQQIKELNYLKERLNQITENKELENLESLWKSFLGDESIKELMSEYSVVDILDGKYGNITKIVLRGVDALEDYVGAKKSSYSGVFGDSGSAWSKLVAAREKMNGISDKSSEEYYKAETAYNTALHNYQSQASAYQSQYGSEEGWDNNLTQEQKDALKADESHNSRGTLMINKGGKDVKFTTGDEISPLSNADVYNDLQDAAKGKRSGNDEGTQLETWKYSPGTTLDVDNAGSIVSGKTFRESFGGSLENWAAAAIADHPEGVVFAKNDDHSKLGIAVGEGYLGAKKSGMYELETARRGSLGLGGGPTLINEEGTEAIITPGGTLTSLPSRTGVVPADITRSVWQLGELAPSILRVLGYNGGGQFTGGSGGIVNNSDSVNIGSVIMQVSADAGFDPERFVEELKTQAALSKNNRR